MRVPAEELKKQVTDHRAAPSSNSSEMASAMHKEDDEIRTEYGNIPLASARSRAEVRVTPAAPGHQREENSKMCIGAMIQQQEIKSHNLTRERDQLLAINNNLAKERDQLQTSSNNLAREAEELKKQFTDHQAAPSSNSSEMASAMHKEDDEIRTEYGNIPLASARSRAEVRVTPAAPGRKLLRVVAVSFGLLCVLQATLNICLRFTLTQQQEIKSHNLTRERDQLQASYNHLSRERDQLQASYSHLTRERDQLQARNNYLNGIIGLRCPQYWHKFQSSCYFVSASKKSWEESRRDCLQRGADLVIINSRGEQAFLKDLQPRFWIGLSDMYKDGQWRWVDGSELINGIWAPGEPNNAGEEKCVEFIQGFDAWNDLACSEKRLSVCEKLGST